MREASELELQLVSYLEERGCPIVQRDLVIKDKNEKLRPDIVGYVIDEEGKSIPKVVAEVKSPAHAKSIPEVQQQLHRYAKALGTPYTLLVVGTQKYWFDADTMLPVMEEPRFESVSRFLEDEKSMAQQLWGLFDIYRGKWSVDQIFDGIISGMLIRAYLYLSSNHSLQKWVTISNESAYRELLLEARNYFNLSRSESIKNIPFLSEQGLWTLNNIPPVSPINGKVLIEIVRKVLAQDPKMGEFVAPANLRDAFTSIVTGLGIEHDEKVIDFGAGFGTILFDLYEKQTEKVRTFEGYEINDKAYDIAQIIGVVSDSAIRYHHEDSLLLEEHDKEYSLAIVDPPLGAKITNKIEYENELAIAARYQNARISELMIEKALNVVKPGGYVVALVTEASLFSSGSSKMLREMIKDRAIIEGIIALPAHTLKPYTGITTSVLILRIKKTIQETAEHVFLGRPKSVDDITDVIESFHNWKKGEKGEQS